MRLPCLTLLCLFSFATFSLNAQNEGKMENMKSQDAAFPQIGLIAKKQGVGFSTGYYTTVGVSYNQFFSPVSAFTIDLGYRIPGGWLGNGENTRIGAIITYEYHYPLNSNVNRLWTVFGTGGLHIAQADYSDRGGLRDYGETFMTSGVTFGLGLSLRWGSFNFSGAWRPAYDFLNYEYGGGKFYVWRCSKVAVRYLF
jgi:hypothetical protein